MGIKIFACVIVSFLFTCVYSPSLATVVEMDSVLANKIAQSLSSRLSKNIKSVAIWDINNYAKEVFSADTIKTEDTIGIAIVKEHKLRLIDRSKLNLILEEQGLSQTGLIDPQQMKKLGKLHGIDALIFGDFNANTIGIFPNITLAIRVIDTETGLLIYADEFPIYSEYMETALDDLNSYFSFAINKEKDYIKKNSINKVAIWKIDNTPTDSAPLQLVINKFYKILVNEKNLKIVDRANLKELLNEQAFGASGLVDPTTAKKIGKLYGVDAFIFGRVDSYDNNEEEDSYNSSIKLTLKMINVNTAQIMWGEELQGTFSKPKKDVYAFFGEEYKEPESWLIPASQSAIIPGWGQKHNGQEEKGNLFLGLELLTIGMGYYAHTQYINAWNSYSSATTRADMDKYFNEANTYHNIRNSCIYLAVGIWLYNIYDAGVNCNAQKTSNVYILPDKDKILVGTRWTL